MGVDMQGATSQPQLLHECKIFFLGNRRQGDVKSCTSAEMGCRGEASERGGCAKTLLIFECVNRDQTGTL